MPEREGWNKKEGEQNINRSKEEERVIMRERERERERVCDVCVYCSLPFKRK
jgi:hypothetical protein